MKVKNNNKQQQLKLKKKTSKPVKLNCNLIAVTLSANTGKDIQGGSSSPEMARTPRPDSEASFEPGTTQRGQAHEILRAGNNPH